MAAAAAAKKQCRCARCSLLAVATPVSNMLVGLSDLVIVLRACRSRGMLGRICFCVLWQRVTGGDVGCRAASVGHELKMGTANWSP